MTLHRLGARLTRLEHDARRVLWVRDFHQSFLRLLAEAGMEIGLAPRSVQELCTVWEETLAGLSGGMAVDVPERAAVAYGERITAAVIAMLETHVPDPQTRYQLRKALSQACHREALRRGGRTA